MAAIRLGPESELPLLIFAKLSVGEEGLKELEVYEGRSTTTPVKPDR